MFIHLRTAMLTDSSILALLCSSLHNPLHAGPLSHPVRRWGSKAEGMCPSRSKSRGLVCAFALATVACDSEKETSFLVV
jgi:hypothetical protein